MIPLKLLFQCPPLLRSFLQFTSFICHQFELDFCLTFSLELLLKFIIKMIVCIDCVSFQDSTHLLRIKASGLTWQISVIQLYVFYFRNIHWLITFETLVRMLNSFLFFPSQQLLSTSQNINLGPSGNPQ